MPQTKKSSPKSQESTPTLRVPQTVLDFQKRVLRNQQTVFESTFKAVTAMQDRQDKVIQGALDQASFVPEQVKEMAVVWADSRRVARDSYKETIDRSFGLYEDWIDGLAASVA